MELKHTQRQLWRGDDARGARREVDVFSGERPPRRSAQRTWRLFRRFFGRMVAESITTPTDAYSLLTNIQGFDSFSLGPASTQEEIVRAFETQKLIWHPDRNPGDVQAAKVYQRMLAAYNALMDPEKRRKIDSGLQTVPQAVQQSASSGTPVP